MLKNMDRSMLSALILATWLLPVADRCFWNDEKCGDKFLMGKSVDVKGALRRKYGPFGEVVRATGPMTKANPFRFSTKYQDDETDLLYYGYRYYSASTGRWLSRDPLGERGAKNIYSFLNNCPVNQVDFLGLEPWPGYPGGPYGPGVGCFTCKCRSVEVTYNPGGSVLELGPYREPITILGVPVVQNWYYNFGSAVHVHWNTDGNAPWLCKYYQDEEGTRLDWQLIGSPKGPITGGPSGSVVGVNGHEAPFDYTDYMGRTFGSPLGAEIQGTFRMVVHWNVTFRCVSSPGSGGGPVSRTDHFDKEATFSVPWW